MARGGSTPRRSAFQCGQLGAPVVVLGISPAAASEDGYKDTERNIRDSGEFVVNLVDGVSILSIPGGRV